MLPLQKVGRRQKRRQPDLNAHFVFRLQSSSNFLNAPDAVPSNSAQKT